MNDSSLPEYRRTHSPWLGTAGAMLCFLAAGCGLPAVQAPDSTSPSACAFPAENPVDRILQWSLGCAHTRQSTPLASGTSIIWQVPAERSGTIVLGQPVARQCVDASSVLPRPDSSEAFIVSGGLLFTVDMKQHRKPVRLERAGESDWSMSRLLALRRTSGPLQILAEMVRKSGSGESADKSLWLLTVRGSVAAGQPFSGLERYRTAKEFSRDFVVPRCSDPEFGECLVVRQQPDNRLAIQHRRGASSTGVPGTQGVIDAAWDGKGQIVLITSGDCSP